MCNLSRHISCKCVTMHATLSMDTHHHVWAFWYLWKFWSCSHWHICACWHTWKFQAWYYVGAYAHFNMYTKFWEWAHAGTYACVDRYVTSKRHHTVLMCIFPHVHFWVWSHVWKFVCLQSLSSETNHMHVLTFTCVHFPVWYIISTYVHAHILASYKFGHMLVHMCICWTWSCQHIYACSHAYTFPSIVTFVICLLPCV